MFGWFRGQSLLGSSPIELNHPVPLYSTRCKPSLVVTFQKNLHGRGLQRPTFFLRSPTVREYVLWLSEQPDSPAGNFVISQLPPNRTHLFIRKGSFTETINLGHATSTTRTVSYHVWIREKIDKHLEDKGNHKGGKGKQTCKTD